MIEVAYRVMLILVAIGTTIFPIYYHVSTGGDWRNSVMGRHVMGYTIAAALVADAGVVRVFLPELPGQDILRMVAIGLAALFVWQRNFIAVKAQRDERTESDERVNETSH